MDSRHLYLRCKSSVVVVHVIVVVVFQTFLFVRFLEESRLTTKRDKMKCVDWVFHWKGFQSFSRGNLVWSNNSIKYVVVLFVYFRIILQVVQRTVCLNSLEFFPGNHNVVRSHLSPRKIASVFQLSAKFVNPSRWGKWNVVLSQFMRILRQIGDGRGWIRPNFLTIPMKMRWSWAKPWSLRKFVLLASVVFFRLFSNRCCS